MISLSAKLLRLLSFFLACSLLTVSLCGCGKKKKKNFVMRTYSTFGAEKDLSAYSAIIAEYTKTHKNVVINDTTTTAANSYKMALSIASTYRGSNAPDVVYFSALSDMSELSDFFMTVDDIRRDYPNFAKNVSPAVLDSTAADDGGRYCIPVRGDWQGIVVNAAMLRKSGLPIPETWDDVIRAARHFSKNEVSLFANNLDDSSALIEYMVRALGGLESVQSAVKGAPDDTWEQTLKAIEQLDELSAFPKMPPESFDSLVSPADLKNTTQGEITSPVELYNHEKAAILLIDNTTCGSVNTYIDSNYIALPRVGTVTMADITTAANSYPTNVISGPVYPRMTANTLPPSVTEETASTTVPATVTTKPTRSTTRQVTSTTTQSTAAQSHVSPSDQSSKKKDDGLYVQFAEGFYITKKAYYDNDKREDILDFVEFFLSEQNCVKLCCEHQAPSLSSLSKSTQDSLTKKSNLYNAVIEAVQEADSFVTSTRTQENSYFWNRCAVAATCLSKGILTRQEALRLIADSQLTVSDIYKERR